MTYATGTINNANPGPTLYADLETHLLAAGFTLVKTVTIGSRTHKVLKSDAADNTYGLDWYLDVHYPTTGAGAIYFTPFEYFDPATDLAYRGPYGANSTTLDGTTYSRYGATGYALETNWWNTSSYTGIDNPIVASTNMGWWLSATTDRVIFMSTAAEGELHYVGFFEPTADHASHAGADMYPLILVHFPSASAVPATTGNTSSTAAMLTRVPKLASVNWNQHLFLDIPYAQFGGAVGSGGHHGATGKTNIARRPVTVGFGGTSLNASAAAAGLVGFLIDVGNTWTDGTIVRGDDLTDTNDDVWIGTTDAANVGLWFKAV